MSRTAEQCQRQREAELWIIAHHWLAEHLGWVGYGGHLLSWEDMPGLTEDEFRRVLSTFAHVARHSRDSVKRWADAVGHDRLVEILAEVDDDGDVTAQQIARGARMADEGES